MASESDDESEVDGSDARVGEDELEEEDNGRFEMLSEEGSSSDSETSNKIEIVEEEEDEDQNDWLLEDGEMIPGSCVPETPVKNLVSIENIVDSEDLVKLFGSSSLDDSEQGNKGEQLVSQEAIHTRSLTKSEKLRVGFEQSHVQGEAEGDHHNEEEAREQPQNQFDEEMAPSSKHVNLEVAQLVTHDAQRLESGDGEDKNTQLKGHKETDISNMPNILQQCRIIIKKNENKKSLKGSKEGSASRELRKLQLDVNYDRVLDKRGRGATQ